MAIEQVREYFRKAGIEERIQEFEVSSATVELAAEALHCEPCRIAKSLSFLVDDTPVLVVTAGDVSLITGSIKSSLEQRQKCSNRMRHRSGLDMRWAVYARLPEVTKKTAGGLMQKLPAVDILITNY